jgi:hypothetical protein
MRILVTTISTCCLVSALGCGGSATPAPAPEPATPKAAPAPAPVAPAPAEAAKPSVDDASFHLALESDPNYSAGQAGTVRLVLQARGGYHVNQDYPIHVDLKAPTAVKLTKPSLGRADAAQFGEESARFDLGFSADKGSHELLATVDFAVCTKETCVPDQRTLAVALNVQ